MWRSPSGKQQDREACFVHGDSMLAGAEGAVKAPGPDTLRGVRRPPVSAPALCLTPRDPVNGRVRQRARRPRAAEPWAPHGARRQVGFRRHPVRSELRVPRQRCVDWANEDPSRVQDQDAAATLPPSSQNRRSVLTAAFLE
jgi:hypothetical protein